jgi:tRNA threonylcarbamoyladenosine biosynthesis protein TsaE
MTLHARSRSVDETRDLARALARLARAGDVVLLAGDLGAGKTAFAQGFGSGLGIDAPITSPTFTLARQYEGRLPLHHLDVYRLESLNEVFDIGLPELLDEDAVVLVEWGDVIAPVLPADFLEIRLTFGEGDDDRTLAFRMVGERWAARRRALEELLQPWCDQGSAAC